MDKDTKNNLALNKMLEELKELSKNNKDDETIVWDSVSTSPIKKLKSGCNQSN